MGRLTHQGCPLPFLFSISVSLSLSLSLVASDLVFVSVNYHSSFMHCLILTLIFDYVLLWCLPAEERCRIYISLRLLHLHQWLLHLQGLEPITITL